MLADAELELAPPEIAGWPAIRKQAEQLGKRPGQVLLDQNLHAAAMGKLEDGKRRGRPDLVHLALLVALESPIAKAGALEVAIHTRHDVLVRLKPDVRLPRSESRFQGLMSKVLAEGRSQDRDPLVWVEGVMPAGEAIRKFAIGPVLRLDEGGEPLTPADICGRAEGGDLTLVLGAFPHGDFSAGWRQAAPQAASVWPQALNVWAVLGELVAAHRAKWGPAMPTAPAAGPRGGGG